MAALGTSENSDDVRVTAAVGGMSGQSDLHILD